MTTTRTPQPGEVWTNSNGVEYRIVTGPDHRGYCHVTGDPGGGTVNTVAYVDSLIPPKRKPPKIKYPFQAYDDHGNLERRLADLESVRRDQPGCWVVDARTGQWWDPDGNEVTS